MLRKILSSLIVFTLFITLFSNVSSAQNNNFIEQPELNQKAQKELKKSMGKNQAKKFKTEVKYDRKKQQHKIKIENANNQIADLNSEVLIDQDNNIEMKINYVDDFNNEVESTYEVLPVVYSETELVAEIIDKKTGERHLINTNELNASVVPVIIAQIIRVGVSAAIGTVGRALVKAAVKKVTFKNKTKFDEHYKKHVTDQKEYGKITKNEYLEIAQNIIGSDSPNVLSKKRADGSRVFYDKKNNDFVVLSKDGYIQTLFKPKDGIAYYNRQK